MNNYPPSKKLPKEIERRFLVKSLPKNLEQYSCEEIRQVYLIMDGEKEVRVRQGGDRYFHTEKIGHGVTHTEIETEITKEQFDYQWLYNEKHRIIKERYRIPYQNLIIELDIYGGSFSGLIRTEVEFSSLEEAEKFIPPDWFGQETTNDPRFHIDSLFMHGIPK